MAPINDRIRLVIIKIFYMKLDKLFNPKTIAVIGASDREESVGYALMKNLIGSNYAGTVYPVSLKHKSVQSIKAYKSVKDIPDRVDLALIATPAKTVPGVVEECGQAGVAGIVIISAGFKEAGREGELMGDRILELAEVAVIALIDDVLADHRTLVMKKKLNLDLDVDSLTVIADHDRLRTVIDNLVSNAVKFTPPGGRINILCRRNQGGWFLDVADSGPGIPQEDRDKVFLPFYQGRLSSPGHVKGTGLGLSIAREIALAHGGDLSLVDGGPSGCRFRLTLPLLEENGTV